MTFKWVIDIAGQLQLTKKTKKINLSISYLEEKKYFFQYYIPFLRCTFYNVAGQHLNASHPKSPVWPNQNVSLFSGNYFLKNFKRSLHLNR